jgi:hypothetical protein
MSEFRSGTKAIAAVGLSLGLGYGAMLAVHENSSLNQEATLIDNCFDHNISSSDKMCFDQPVTTAEAKQLSLNANTYGDLGWLAFGGSIIGFAASIEVITGVDIVSSTRKKRNNSSTAPKPITNSEGKPKNTATHLEVGDERLTD